MGTFPNVNRVGGMGGAKVPGLRNVELTGPYFHNGGKVTLRQVVNFYAHGGDFPVTNGPHKDFHIVDLDHEVRSVLSPTERNRPDRVPAQPHRRTRGPRAGAIRPARTVRPGRRPRAGQHRRTHSHADAKTTTRTAARRSASAACCPSGAAGNSTRLPAFLNVQRVPTPGVNNDIFDQ